MQNTLPQNYELNSRYTILHQIGQGGFGITYKAYDSVFDRDVCIKELFLSGNSRREKSLSITSQAIGSIDFSYFKNKFLEEAKKLAKFDHPNIVKVLEYFEANNTAYMVMDFIEGKNLKAYVQEEGKLDEETALGIFNQLLQATEVIHSKNYLHRDIKPDNIIITPENKAVLIDFGTAKFHDNQNSDTSTLVLLSHGYAPPEQYSNQNKKDKYTDVYSVGATLYFMLTARKPVQATDRFIKEFESIHKFQSEISQALVNVVEKAMQLKPKDRYQSVIEIKKSIEPIHKQEKHGKSGTFYERLYARVKREHARVKVTTEKSVVNNNQKKPFEIKHHLSWIIGLPTFLLFAYLHNSEKLSSLPSNAIIGWSIPIIILVILYYFFGRSNLKKSIEPIHKQEKHGKSETFYERLYARVKRIYSSVKFKAEKSVVNNNQKKPFEIKYHLSWIIGLPTFLLFAYLHNSEKISILTFDSVIGWSIPVIILVLLYYFFGRPYLKK